VERLMRVGSGLDVHAFDEEAGRPLVLAGTTIADVPGLAGHSDADVVCHAVADALLGAAALGDLGSVFGTDDPALAGASSQALLAEVVRDVVRQGWAIGNLDVTVVAQRPRLAAYRPAMRQALATILGVDEDRVSVKLTTTDRLGSIGRGEGIACWATVLLVPGG
jgi:2-C-methyl-D-erythritol 2,4-cyclodiphosphate synthase